jgi:hypothetical protein
MVLLAGAVLIGALLMAQWRLLNTRPEHFGTERLRGALYLTLLFASFAILHRYVTEAEQPEQPCCLTVFEGPEEPGRVPPPPPPPPPPRPGATE